MTEGESIAGSKGKISRRRFLQGACGTLLLAGIAPARAQIMMHGREDAWVEQARQIGMGMLAYATDNNGNYPDGRSSTEVFQKLMDNHYIGDSSLFLVSLVPGKTKATTIKLLPENICFDVTCCLDITSPDSMPLVYLTGFKVSYKPGSSAVSLLKPPLPGIAVTYKNSSSKFLKPADPIDGSITNFIPADFPTDKAYRQLTPDGPMTQ